MRKNDIIKKFFDIVLKELELKDTYIIDEGGDFLFIDYKQFQKCYGDGNYKSFLATCRDIELLEVFYAHTISPIMIAILTSLIMVVFIG